MSRATKTLSLIRTVLFVALLGAPGARAATVADDGEGVFRLIGTESPAQIFNRPILYRCTVEERGTQLSNFVAIRNSCDPTPILVTDVNASVGARLPLLNENISLPAGYYVLGFENSIYPGFIKIEAGRTTQMELVKVLMPSADQGFFRVYRDTGSLGEQIKSYFTTYVLGRHMFPESSYESWSNGDLYVSANGYMDIFASVNGLFATCDKRLVSSQNLSQKSARLCAARANESFMGMAEFFDFATGGKFVAYGVDRKGAPARINVGRQLVGMPFRSIDTTFVNVLPGNYLGEFILPNGSVKKINIGAIGPLDSAGRLVSSFGEFPDPSSLRISGVPRLSAPQTSDPNSGEPMKNISGPEDDGDEVLAPGQTCASSKMWKTEWRTHCRADSEEGCDRSTAKMCEPMFNTK